MFGLNWIVFFLWYPISSSNNNGNCLPLIIPNSVFESLPDQGLRFAVFDDSPIKKSGKNSEVFTLYKSKSANQQILWPATQEVRNISYYKSFRENSWASTINVNVFRLVVDYHLMGE